MEVEARPPNLEPIVRVTIQHTTSTVSPNIRHVSVHATYLRKIGAPRLLLVELTRYCGEYWGPHFPADSLNTANALVNHITGRLKALSLSPCPGSYQDLEPQPDPPRE